MNAFPYTRLQRLRRTPGIRAMCNTAPLPYSHFIWPVFVIDGENQEHPIPSMPGQYRLTVDRLIAHLEHPVTEGLGGIMIFGVPGTDTPKDNHGAAARDANGIVPRAVRAVKAAYPDLITFTDVCLCAYTSHGHCAPLDHAGRIDNDAALDLLARTAVTHASAGADGVAPSAMMDGQVHAIRDALHAAHLSHTLLMSYSTKFASALYGPFRDAADSAPAAGDRRSYQCSYQDARTALRESDLDASEGADILMVKPATYYLDIIRQLHDRSDLPLAAYNVSGEYAMIHAAAQAGYGDLYALAHENLCAIQRAGADIVLSYWANQYGRIFPGAH